jgi:hypothetical protein
MGRTKSEYNWQGTGRLAFYDDVTFETLFTTHPVKLEDDFLHPVTDETNDWTESDDGGTSAAGAVAVGIPGYYMIDTGTDADKYHALSSELCFKAALGCGCEVRLATTTADAAMMMAFGFSDAKVESTGTIAWKDDSLVSGTVDANADDAVMFGVRAETSDSVYALSVLAAGTPQSTDTGTDIALDTYHIYRIQIDALGNARYFIDGALVAEHLLAVTTTDPLCFTIQALITAGSTADFVKIDYVKVWQERS